MIRHVAAAVCLSVVGHAHAASLSPADIDALGRVVYAEAGTQPAAGKAAVLGVILNRATATGIGVQDVIDAPGQFEPVLRSPCRSWRCLHPLTPVQRVEFGTILQLAATGKLADVSGGATHFQNEQIVANRAAAGKVRPSLVGFGGMPVTTRIADHTFYAGKPSSRSAAPRQALRSMLGDAETAFPGSDSEPGETVFLSVPEAAGDR